MTEVERLDAFFTIDWKDVLRQLLAIGAFFAIVAILKTVQPRLIGFFREWKRPPNLWAIIGYVAAYPVLFYQLWSSIDPAASSTAAIGYVFVPLASAIEGLIFAGMGYAFGSVILALQTRTWRDILIATTALTIAIAYIIYTVIDNQHMRELEKVVQRVSRMDDAEMQIFLDSGDYRNNRYALAAVAMNSNASRETLAWIVSIPDPALHGKFGGTPELMGDNRKGLAVMRLVARHPNVSPESLEHLSLSNVAYVLGDVAGNAATPTAAIESIFERRNQVSDSYLIEWGLASNEAAPEHILLELAVSSRNEYTLRNIAKNDGASGKTRKLARSRIDQGDYNQY